MELRMRIREIAQSRVRYWYRKIRVLLNREGWDVGKHLVYRLYKEEGLALKKPPQLSDCTQIPELCCSASFTALKDRKSKWFYVL
jgi:hypothetical protein